MKRKLQYIRIEVFENEEIKCKKFFLGGGKKEKNSQISNVEKNIIILELLILLAVCILYTLAAGHYVDFWPTNGTFQNFNPIRRMIAGQIPYKDFQDYLGMGHLYIGTLATVCFGGDYQASLVAFSFLTFLGFVLVLIIIGNAIFRKKTIALGLINIILAMLIVQPFFFSNVLVGTTEINNALWAALTPGNSARFVRGMILPISCILVYISYKIYKKIEFSYPNILRYKIWIELSGIGLIAGGAFIWSNDYGISCWVCFMIMTFVFVLAKTRKIVKAIFASLVEFIVSVASIFIFVEVFTLGHFSNWMDSMFGTGGYQSWYYNSDKSYYLYDVDFSFLMMLQGVLCIIYLVFLFKSYASKEALVRYGILAFCNMVSFCAVNEYHLLSGGSSKEVSFAVLFVTILFEVCHYIGVVLKKEENKKNIIVIVSFMVSIAWIVSDLKEELIFWQTEDKQGEYIEALGGNIRSWGKDLKDTADFLADEEFFSTYASAQEVVCGVFQPSGTDYIIHALGDEARKKYLECFKNGTFKYTATIREELTIWEYWIQRGNWFFYRELYRAWHPVYFNAYEMYWEKNMGEENNTLSGVCSVRIEKVDEAVTKVIVETDLSVNGIADVYIDYEVRKNNKPISKFLFQSMLKVENTGMLFSDDRYYESNYLRKRSGEFVPVRVVNGYGEITLTASPAASTYLVLNKAECSDIYSVVFNYVECLDITNGDEEIVISVSNNIKNQKALENIIGIIIGGNEYPVSEIKSDEQNLYIIILKDGIENNLNRESIKYNNVLQLIKEF